jgi:hypothetical protein
MKCFCLAIAVVLQGAEGLSAAPDVMQQPGVGAATHLGLGAASLARPAETLRALVGGAPRAAGVQPAALPPRAAPRPRSGIAQRAGAPAQGARDGAWCEMRRRARGRLGAAGQQASLFAPHSFHTLHAEMPAVRRVDIWGSHWGFRTLRGSVAVAFEGAAAVRVREHLSLTAGFRLLGYGPGAAGQLEGAKFDTGIAAPFLGLALRF